MDTALCSTNYSWATKGGFLDPGAKGDDGREQAVMTFRVAHHYTKYGDPEDENFAAGADLYIDNITHHDAPDGNIYWQVEKGRKKGYVVKFHNKPPGRDGKIQRLSGRSRG